MKIPLVLLTWNKPTITRDCIQSIEKFTEPGLLDVIICDNGSTQPGMSEYLKELEEKYTLIRNVGNYIHRGWIPGIKLAMKKYPDFPYFLLSDPDIQLTDSIPRNWPELFLKFMEKHKEVAKVGVWLDVERTEDEAIKRHIYGSCHGIFTTDVVPDKCIAMLISTTLSMWRWTTFPDIEKSQLNNHHYGPGFSCGGVRVADRFTCIHLGWEMWKEKYRSDYEFTVNQDTRTYMTSVRRLRGWASLYSKQPTDMYKGKK